MPGHRILLIGGDGLVGHAREVIVGGVVFAHMIEAEMEIAPLVAPPHRRAVLAGTVATGVIAGAHRLLPRFLGAAADADSVEEA